MACIYTRIADRGKQEEKERSRQETKRNKRQTTISTPPLSVFHILHQVLARPCLSDHRPFARPIHAYTHTIKVGYVNHHQHMITQRTTNSNNCMPIVRFLFQTYTHLSFAQADPVKSGLLDQRTLRFGPRPVCYCSR
jgi:hypothetical protein